MQELKSAIAEAAKKLYQVDIEPELSRPEEQFGDYSTNVAMQLAPQLNKNPRSVAEQLAAHVKGPSFHKVEAVGAGFINFWLSDEALAAIVARSLKPAQPNAGKEILIEFGNPNPFKEMHIGHLYSYIVGDSIAKLLEASGSTVRRLSYHGDVGLHVAKAIYGLRELNKEHKKNDEAASNIVVIERENFLGKAYAYGADRYENDKPSQEKIDKINLHVYKQDDSKINELWKRGCELSFDYFDKILDLLSISNDKRYLESQTLVIGKEFVEANLKSVFKKSQGAIVYEGEKAGLHTRVFITSQGLPTYEAKDLGLTELKNQDYPNADRSIVVTATEQSEYFKVMLAALAEIDKQLATKTTHLSHGFLSLTSGKMSSRSGNVYSATELLLEVKAAVHEQYPDSEVRKEVSFGAVKYAFLKHRLGSDIVFDIKESISLEGNSGPYLQYAHARACSILVKGRTSHTEADVKGPSFQAKERSLARKISEYPEVVEKAVNELMPHHVCTYLYELAQVFNRFYESNRVVGDPRESLRLALVKSYSDVLKNGLELLNIPVPERM